MPKANREEKKHAGPSSNWIALQRTLSSSSRTVSKDGVTSKKPKLGKRTSDSPGSTSGAVSASPPSRKRRKLAHDTSTPHPAPAEPESRWNLPPPAPTVDEITAMQTKNGESILLLRKMVLGQLTYSSNQRLPGKYLAMDCEMVGIGIDGVESSLARVSLVNYYGAVQLDEIVRQRERVVDYRTQWSGIRESDMIKAKPFEEVQKLVAEMLKDRILVGHAVFNDLQALLLSHPRPQTRDTQHYAGKHKVTKSKYPALRNLVKQELDVTIQGGEHSSVTDARATMAIYRLHRKEWEKGTRPVNEQGSKKRKTGKDAEEDQDDAQEGVFPGGGRRGVSSGLSTVVKRGGSTEGGSGAGKTQWWKELGGGSSKGSVTVKAV